MNDATQIKTNINPHATNSDKVSAYERHTADETPSTPEEVRDEAELEDYEDFVPLSVSPALPEDEDDASHQVIEKDEQNKEVVVPIMPLV